MTSEDQLDATLERARGMGIFGTKMRSVVKEANEVGIATNVVLLWSIAVVMAVFRDPIMSTLSSDPEVIRLGSLLLLFQAGMQTTSKRRH